jgi:hypothetical protein
MLACRSRIPIGTRLLYAGVSSQSLSWATSTREQRLAFTNEEPPVLLIYSTAMIDHPLRMLCSIALETSIRDTAVAFQPDYTKTTPPISSFEEAVVGHCAAGIPLTKVVFHKNPLHDTNVFYNCYIPSIVNQIVLQALLSKSGNLPSICGSIIIDSGDLQVRSISLRMVVRPRPAIPDPTFCHLIPTFQRSSCEDKI